MNAAFLLVLQAACSCYLAGLIWTIQLVHYPSFRFVDHARFLDFEGWHRAAITPIVAPAMILELGLSVLLLSQKPAHISRNEAWIGVALVLLAWGTTFFLSVPAHERLSMGFSVEAWKSLVQTNWIRTFAWTARAGLCGYWLLKSMR